MPTLESGMADALIWWLWDKYGFIDDRMRAPLELTIKNAIAAAYAKGLEDAAQAMEAYYGFSDDERRIAASTIRSRIKDRET